MVKRQFDEPMISWRSPWDVDYNYYVPYIHGTISNRLASSPVTGVTVLCIIEKFWMSWKSTSSFDKRGQRYITS